MTYSILDFNLSVKAARFKALASAAKHAIENFDQAQVWFIEDSSGEIEAIIHCDSVWIPTPVARLEDISGL